MEEGVFLQFKARLFNVLLVFYYVNIGCCIPSNYLKDSIIPEKRTETMLPEISPTGAPQPFLPLLAPSPLSSIINSTVPKLSGDCILNFTAAESMMNMTSIDCSSGFASVLANVICCPQLKATLAVLLGQVSKATNALALNATVSEHCLLDIDQILERHGAAENLHQLCSIHSLNLTEASCPVKYVNDFERIVDVSELLTACEKIDPVKECCDRTCQNAISEASRKLALEASNVPSAAEAQFLHKQSTMINDCRNIVLHWLASQIESSQAKEILRGLSSCHLNKVCPLGFPDTRHVAMTCGDGISNQTGCCSAIESYVSHLQEQSLITNIQALNCATSLGVRLQKENITKDIYRLCHITLKDFSIQVGPRESGCLLPSLPSDVGLGTQGITFVCDLNDNIPAPWPSTSQLPALSCNRKEKIPALPAAAASSQSGLYNAEVMPHLLLALSIIFMMTR